MMKNKKIKSPKIYFIISFLSIFIFSFIVFYIFESQMNNIKLEELKKNEEELVDLENKLIGEDFRTILGDLHYLHHIYNKELNDNKNKEGIASDWIEFADQRWIYDQIRFIDRDGDEIIRINYDGNKSYAVEESQLQNKKDRYYFYETINLKEEEVYVSPLDLNIEGAKIEIPFKPMLRFSTPIYDEKGQTQGIIILNYLANSVLNNFKQLGQNGEGEVSLLNSNGYWLSNDDEKNEWNFMFADKKDINFQEDYPEEWETIKNGRGQILTENGIFTFATVHLNHHYIQGDEYELDESIVYSEGTWYIVSHINLENNLAPYFLNDFLLIIKDVFKKNSYQLILIAFISAMVGWFVYENRRKYYEIKYYSEYDPLTKTLNRRSGYEKIDRLVYKDDRRKNVFSLCFIDVNGLKQVNDNLGHEPGDELLVTVCDVIKLTIRENDFIIRIGGDEFLVVLDGIDAVQSEDIWKRIVFKFEEINLKESRPYIISVSHGIVEYNNEQKTEINDLIQKADEKMYKEKEIVKRNLNVLR